MGRKSFPGFPEMAVLGEKDDPGCGSNENSFESQENLNFRN
jgi:hypothetical protein